MQVSVSVGLTGEFLSIITAAAACRSNADDDGRRRWTEPNCIQHDDECTGGKHNNLPRFLLPAAVVCWVGVPGEECPRAHTYTKVPNNYGHF